MKIGNYGLLVCLAAVSAGSAFAGVTVTSPTKGATVTSPVKFSATGASPACKKGVASIALYTAPGVLAYETKGAKLSTSLSLSAGTYNTSIKEVDNCGWSASVAVPITVSGGGSPPPPAGPPQTFSNLQQSTWTGYALLPPAFSICSSCTSAGPQLLWSWTPDISSPSLSGSATATYYGAGSKQWADVLWNNHLIGNFSSQGLPDPDKKLVPTLHSFTYDVYFWVSDTTLSQAMEFDINQFVGGKSYIWGHECRIDGGNEWDTWSNQKKHWVPSGIACNPVSNAWNHLTIQVERTSDDGMLFKSITLNGNVGNVNRSDTPTKTSWYGVTINYQLDGDREQQPYTVYLDNFTFTYQ
jgi:hypothetical protein